MNRFLRGISLYLLIAIIAVSIVSSLYPTQERREEITFSQFMQWVEQNRIASVTMIGEQLVEGELRDGTLFTTFVPVGTTNLGSMLIERGVQVSAQREPQPPFWMSLLPHLLTVGIFIVLWLFIINQMQGGSNRAMSFGKSRAKLHTEERTKVRFDDVAGLNEAKEELIEIVEFLKHPKRFAELGAKVPKGVLLVGPPGTGKTLLARAGAGEAGVPFFSISGSDFVEMFVGVGASRVRDLFDTAKKNAPCIVFIDELDAVGRQRGAGLGGGHDEREQTLNQMLVEMDGFEPNTGIIVMAATNRPDVLDPALLRPGRFDRKIVVDRPDIAGREAILKVHARNKPLAKDVDLKVIARRTPGFSGADLESVMNEGAILAARRNRKEITMADLEEAIDRVVLGPERKGRVLTPRVKEVYAYHEAGHALVAHYLPHANPVHKVTIIGRGMAGGYTQFLPREERAYLMTRSELLDELAAALGGRAAEELKFNEVSTGAKGDLEEVTRLARKMVMEWGMSQRLGPQAFGRPAEENIFLGRDIARDRNYSEEVAAAIDQEVRSIIDEAHRTARQVLQEHWDQLVAVGEALIDRETLTRAEFLAVIGEEEQVKKEAAEEAQAAVEEPAAQATEANPAGVEPGRPGKPAVSDEREERVLEKGKHPKPAIGLE
ncbi:MAG: ATP-dependent metallopeptidase FtsH/Yme1/Tma family protein [Firmicutes bacterium]|nr:ATP-dependent metallopeptidase FtsH/Yme1/Tma family protein [Bacillota bacterium]